MGRETTFYPFRAIHAREHNPAYDCASRYRSTMLSGPIYETGSIGWAKGGHGLAHTDLIFKHDGRYPLFTEDGTGRDYSLVDISPKSH